MNPNVQWDPRANIEPKRSRLSQERPRYTPITNDEVKIINFEFVFRPSLF